MTGKPADARTEAAAFDTARGKVPAETFVVSFNNGPTVLAVVSHLLRGQLAVRLTRRSRISRWPPPRRTR